MKNEISEHLRKFARFARRMRNIRTFYPEHAREIDQCLYDVAQKLHSCSDPNCECKMSFEEFHAATNSILEEELREKSYELT